MSGEQVTSEAGRRWPYVIVLASVAAAAMGLAFAPISGIVYALSIPGLLVASVWAIRSPRAPGRAAILVATALMLLGFLTGVGVVWWGRATEATAPQPNSMLEMTIPLTLVYSPVASILVGLGGGAYGLGSMRRAPDRPAYSASVPASNEPVR